MEHIFYCLKYFEIYVSTVRIAIWGWDITFSLLGKIIYVSTWIVIAAAIVIVIVIVIGIGIVIMIDLILLLELL